MGDADRCYCRPDASGRLDYRPSFYKSGPSRAKGLGSEDGRWEGPGGVAMATRRWLTCCAVLVRVVAFG